jgi:hypothetical protein
MADTTFRLVQRQPDLGQPCHEQMLAVLQGLSILMKHDAVIRIHNDSGSWVNSGDRFIHPMQGNQGQQRRNYTPNKVAQSLLEFSTSIPRNELRPSYGEGFLGAPIQIGMHRQAPTPAVQGDDRGSSKSSIPSNPGDAHHV